MGAVSSFQRAFSRCSVRPLILKPEQRRRRNQMKTFIGILIFALTILLAATGQWAPAAK
jgi:predicted nucleic acid-binding Zn ribbon protein